MDILIRMLNELPLGKREAINLIESAPRRYKIYAIPKRTPGQYRIIAHPSKELKLVQRWVTRSVLAQLPIHKAAMAYQAGTSILENAKLHRKQKYLLKLDIKNFFPSIKPEHFLAHYQKYAGQVSEIDKKVLTQILFRRNKETKGLELSIGAPSSPLLSNTVFFPIDETIQAYCSNLEIIYSRYADDLTFSTNTPNILTDVPQAIAAILAAAEYPKLTLNTAKTVHSSKKHNRRITGLTITPNGSISIGRDKKREIKSLIHRFIQNELKADEVNNLTGQLSFISSVEPSFIDSLRNKYGSSVLERLFKRPAI